MARWGKMTERGCYTLTKEIKQKLRDVANGTQLAESKHVRNALTLYVPYYLPPEMSGMTVLERYSVRRKMCASRLVLIFA